MTLRIGFVGCGLIAQSHASRLSGVDGADIVAVHDISSERADAFAEAHGAITVPSSDAVIEQSDAIYVTTWTSEHPRLVADVASAGKPVFCEKPLGVDLASAQSMFADVAAAGVTNQVGLVLRHSPSFRVLQHHLHSERSGDRMSLVFRDDQFIPIQGMYASTWRSDVSKAGAGALLEHSIHDLDLIEWMMGRIERVSCVTKNFHGIEGIEDQATVLLTAADGSTTSLSSTWHDVVSRPSQRYVEAFCRNVMLTNTGDWNGPLTIQTSEGDPVSYSDAELIEMSSELGGGHNPDADFVSAVLEGRPAFPDFAVALRAHELADAAYRSAAEDGAPVEV